MGKNLTKDEKFENLVDHFTDKAIRIFTEGNQYLYFEHESRLKLREIYSKLLSDIYKLCNKGQINISDIEKLMCINTKEMCNFLMETNGEDIFKKQKKAYIHTVICAQYSPEFQIKILNIDVKKLIQPVLDLGCGVEARLVKYLRNLGVDAYGVDRNLESNEHLFKSDWFDMKNDKERWGTIISHMAFSNHVWHHQNRKDGHIEKFLIKFKELLNSLKVGGSFIYAPGLPQVEEYIGDLGEYKVEKYDLNYNGGENRFYSAKITKLR